MGDYDYAYIASILEQVQRTRASRQPDQDLATPHPRPPHIHQPQNSGHTPFYPPNMPPPPSSTSYMSHSAHYPPTAGYLPHPSYNPSFHPSGTSYQPHASFNHSTASYHYSSHHPAAGNYWYPTAPSSFLPNPTQRGPYDVEQQVTSRHLTAGTSTSHRNKIPLSLADSSGFEMTYDRFGKSMAEPLEYGSSGEWANRPNNLSSSTLKALEARRRTVFPETSSSNGLVWSSGPGSSRTSLPKQAVAEPENYPQSSISSASSESTDSSSESESPSESEESGELEESRPSESSELTATSKAVDIIQPRTSTNDDCYQPYKKLTKEEKAARREKNRAAKRYKNDKKKARKRLLYAQSEWGELETELANQEFEAWAAAQEPFVPNRRAPPVSTTPPSSSGIAETSATPMSVIGKSIVENADVDLHMESIGEVAGTPHDKDPEDYIVESGYPSSRAGSSGASSFHNNLGNPFARRSTATNKEMPSNKKMPSVENRKSTRFNPYGNLGWQPTMDVHRTVSSSLTGQEGNVDSSMISTRANETESRVLTVPGRIL